METIDTLIGVARYMSRDMALIRFHTIVNILQAKALKAPNLDIAGQFPRVVLRRLVWRITSALKNEENRRSKFQVVPFFSFSKGMFFPDLISVSQLNFTKCPLRLSTENRKGMLKRGRNRRFTVFLVEEYACCKNMVFNALKHPFK